MRLIGSHLGWPSPSASGLLGATPPPASLSPSALPPVGRVLILHHRVDTTAGGRNPRVGGM
eukprot:7961157-Pyramimonas_sp.AAC.1